MRLAVEIVRSLASDLRATLPSDEHEAGVFLAGMVWMFVIHWALLIFVSWLWLKAAGAH